MKVEINKKLPEPWSQSWPKDDLELVLQCPVCEGCEREVLHSELVDNVFRVAPGKWTLWQCTNCASAYLDPRPTEASIGRAYETYYTHNTALKKEQPDQLGRLRLFRRALANSYLNDRYGTQYQPVSRFGPFLAGIIPSQRQVLDVQFRWLPKPKTGQRLLDVGFGSGTFLHHALDAGWHIEGVDQDQVAVANAKEQGLNVRRGGIEVYCGQHEIFDVITISHVIEHVHDPAEVLKQAYTLLKPGGTLYLDTPNIHSLGAKIFGANWRGIESPRHLTLFSMDGVQMLFKQCGFVDIKFIYRNNVTKGMFLSSLRLTQGVSPYNTEPRSLPFRLLLRTYFLFLPAQHREFITLLARKEVS